MAGASIHSKSRATQFSSKEIEDLRRGTWKIECSRVTLKSHATNASSTFAGPGFIQQAANGQLTYQIYSTKPQIQKYNSWDDSLQAGVAVPEAAFYDLIATDERGRVWESDRLFPVHVNWTASGKPIVGGNIVELHSNGKYSKNIRFKGNWLKMLVFDDVKFPRADSTRIRKSVAGERPSRSFTRNAWKFTCLGYRFLLVQEQDDLFKIEIFSEKKFRPYLFQRVAETLQFVLGRPTEWSVREERIGSKTHLALRSQRMNQAERLFFYPFPSELVLDPTTNKLTSAYHRRAFEHYFKHVIDFDESHHLLWAQLNAVYQASHPLFLDTIALTLSVTIETLLSSEFPKLGMPTPGELRYIEKIKQYVKEWNGDPTVKQRVVGSISQMHTSRAGDKLYALVRKGVITEDQYKHWKKLRNASAHSFQSGTLTNQELLELVQHVQMLFYHLVFHAIGYKGLYLDFDTPGWPLKSYPP